MADDYGGSRGVAVRVRSLLAPIVPSQNMMGNTFPSWLMVGRRMREVKNSFVAAICPL
jgi:hypothetical protein